MNHVSATHEIAARRPLSALLSQVLVAYTVELDNEFERRMRNAGYYAGARFSLVVWTNTLRFVGKGIPVHELRTQALAADNHVKFGRGCLERWGIIVL